jgi:hypothetical protein
MSDFVDNPKEAHKQELQALIDKLTTGTKLQYSEEDSSKPFLKEESEEEFAATTEPVIMTKIMIGGVEYETHAVKKIVSDTAEQVLYKKGDRDGLSTDERQILFKSATSTVHNKYDVMPLSLNDEDKLDHTYNLEVLVQRTK